MYVPYLYGLSGELLALRDLAAVPKVGNVLPVIEPVNANPDGLIRALTTLQAAAAPVSVIVNPTQRDFSVPSATPPWLASLRPSLSLDAVRPAFLVDSGVTLSDVNAFIAAFPSEPLVVVIRTGVPSASDLAHSFSSREVLVVVHHSVNEAAYVASFGIDRVIPLTDSFIGQARNADYAGSDWFTSDHASFIAAGRPGFGDYTVLGTSPSRPGGGPPGAVVIHASYLHTDGNIWVRHFVSDTTERNEGSAGEKLMEAMNKLRAERAIFLDSPGMIQYDTQYTTNSPTSLGTNKRQQISHHIFTAAYALP